MAGSYLAGIGAGALVLAGLCFLMLADTMIPPEVHAAVAGLVLAGIGGALLCLHRILRRAERRLAVAAAELGRLKALVEAQPGEWCAWGAAGVQAASPGLTRLLHVPEVHRLDDVEAALAPSDAAALHGSFRHLAETGKPFRITVRLADGSRCLEIEGRRGEGADGGALEVLWLRDGTRDAAMRHQLAEARRRAEAEVRRLHTALDLLPVPLWLRDGDLRIIWCNQAFARMLDSTPDGVVADGLELPGGALSDPPIVLARAARAGGRAESDSRYLVVAGDRRLFLLTEAPVAEGTLLLGHALDQTDRRELQDELHRHIAAHGEVLEQLGSAIAIYGADTRLKFHNHAYARLWDLDPAWLETEPTYGEVLEDLRARRKLTEEADFRHWKKQRLALFTSLLEPQEDLEHLPDGRTLRSLAVPHPFGGLMFVLEDVTHTLALESSYNTLMAVQQETLDNLAEGVCVFGSDGRLKLFNPAFTRLWRLNPAELRSEPHANEVLDAFRPLLGDEGWPARKTDILARLLDRHASVGDLERTDGSVLRWSQVPLPNGAVLFSCLDITDSVRVEQALRASNAALETADRLKAEFIANVSYQLRTPLNAIMGFAEILQNQYFGPLNERQMDYARGMLEASRRLLTLINDILDLATIEAGFMVLDRERVDIAPLLESVAGLTRDWARKQSLNLKLDIPDGIGVLEGDEKRLKQALFNLVGNAIKFTPAGGIITLSAHREGAHVDLCVSDTGVGIPKADQQRVFGRFERAGPAEGPRGQLSGAGLGLSLVKSFIELHGGNVSIDSSPQTGTTIRCRLPARWIPPVTSLMEP